jgi:uncharacterized paraquat-inducible protein A
MSRSLRAQFPRRWDVPVLLGLAVLSLPFGLTTPTLTLSHLAGTSPTTFSVTTGILDLFRGGDVFLAFLLFTFSFVFPIAKLVALSILWLRRMSPDSRDTALHALKVLGKWSMLDVFVVIVFVGAVQLGVLASAVPRFGIHLFASAIVLSMIVTYLEYCMAGTDAKDPGNKRKPGFATIPVAILGLLFLIAGLVLPLMEVKKRIFWNREFSIVQGAWTMVGEGQSPLAGLLLLFVVVIPVGTLLSQTVLIFLRRSEMPSGKLVLFLEFVEKWAMVDVFALGLLVVVVEIHAIADVTPGLGLGCLLAGAFLSMSSTWLIRK